MNQDQLTRLRSKIEAELCGLESAAESAKTEVRSSAEVNPNSIRDESDSAKGDIDLNTALEIHSHSIAQQKGLRGALARMATGTFGTCLCCNEDIGPRRLEAHPAATLCIECQECRERGFPIDPQFPPALVPPQIRWAA